MELFQSVQKLVLPVVKVNTIVSQQSTDNGVASLSFTAQWLTESFQQKSAVLNVLPLENSHTG